MAVLSTLSKYLIFVLLGAILVLWEIRDPLQKIKYQNQILKELRTWFLVVVFYVGLSFMVRALGIEIVPEAILEKVGLAGILSIPVWQRLIIAYLLADFTYYAVHWAQHNTKVMWLTHSWHHTMEPYWCIAGIRDTFTATIIYKVLFFGWFPLLGIPAKLLYLVALHYTVHVLWEHLNIKGHAWMGIIEWFYNTPRFHIIHHACPGKNFCNMFTIWDRIFGTYVNPETFEGSLDVISSGEPETVRMVLGI